MTERIAKVESLDALKSLKRAVWKFSESANLALTDAEGEMTRALMWLETEQLQYWQTQLRKRADHVERCKEAVRMKKLFKDSTGRYPSTVDEEKALRLAMRRHEEAEQKLANVKKYTQRLRKELLMYKGQVQRFATAVQNDLPVASAQLDGLLEKLEQYVALGAPEEVRSSARAATSQTSLTDVTGGMSRGQPAEVPAEPDEAGAPPPSPPDPAEPPGPAD